KPLILLAFCRYRYHTSLFFRPLFLRRRPSVLCLLSTVGGLQKAGGYGFLILMDRLNPELQT
ncbi:MAG: hypothetical protein ACLTFS_19320, partial [Flavonifractor plautii]